MKLIHSIYLLPLALLTGCHSEAPFTPSRECGPIELRAGIVEGGAAVTKAGGEDNHARHLNLTADTQLALSVSGTWTGHSPSPVVQATTATVGSATGADNKHNALSCSPVLFWDDYGTADPTNAGSGKGREEGLTIYGVAINGKNSAPTVDSFTALVWTLYADQTQTNQKPEDTDLLISNNVKSSTAVANMELNTGTYKFDERTYGKLLEFTHALSKITVNLKAGAGFGGSFASAPTVTLYGSWAYTTGTVNVSTGAWSSLSGAAVVTMFQLASATTGYNVTKEALVIPGSAFASDATDIIRINADGNIYYVNAEKIRTAINSSTHGTDGAYATEAGKNYIFNVTVNKTSIDVTATVTNWTDVTAAEVEPEINVSGDLGGTAVNLNADWACSFYRSTSLNSGYIGAKTNGYYAEESVLSYTNSTTTWSMSPILYWPNHNTHYQFRGVWPRTGTETGEVTYPRVEDGSDDTAGCQVIKVKNVAYLAGSFPSDLMIARPDVEDADNNCGNGELGHTLSNLYQDGICAREGTINLTFQYMMSQVEVNLTTTTGSDKVDLDDAVVDIINAYNNGDVKLGDRSVVPTGDKGHYTLDTVTGEGNENKRRSAIVPQVLTYDMNAFQNNLKFRIKITNTNGTPSDVSDDTIDTYYADVAPIKKSGSSYFVAPTGKWESGVHYVYNLKLSKTEIKISATLATWTTVIADENVWF